MSTVNIKINGKNHQPEAGVNILKFALEQGINIPNLCYDSRLTPGGACRMCIVQIEGRSVLVRDLFKADVSEESLSPMFPELHLPHLHEGISSL